MYRNNVIQLNEMENFDVVDIELLRIEKLIEEQLDYEEGFLSMETTPIEEFNHTISQYENEIEKQELEYQYSQFDDLEDDFVNPFGYEDYLIEKRDEMLIKEREEYESNFLIVDENVVLDNIYNFQIASLLQEDFIEENEYDYDFKYENEFDDYEYDEYEEAMFWELFYLKETPHFMEPAYCGSSLLDYVPNDDVFDNLDCYDYPEGPDENLCGVKIPQIFY